MAAVLPASWIGEVSGSDLMHHTSTIAQWVRLSGTEDERKAFDYVAGVLQGYGLQTTLHLPTCLVSLPISGAIQIGDEQFGPCITHAFSIATASDGISGQLVYAGRGTRQELAAAQVHGKIALTDGLATPNKAHDASEAGALGVISISGPHIHEMIVSPVWGSPTPDRLGLLPRVAMLSIDTTTGERLKARVDAGPTRVTVHTTVDTRWRQIPVMIADLDVSGRDYVMFSGHIDSWHYGAMDNGSANATMIETARIMAEHRAELRRGIRFAFWSGHSHARYAGSAWFADRYWFDLHEHCVAHVNVDSAGAIGATNLTGANTMAETYPLARDIIGRQTDQELTYKRFGRAGDQSFWGVGLSSLYMSMSEQGEPDEMTADQAFLLGGTTARGGGLGWWWHTTEDTLDKVDEAHLVRDTRVYVETVGRLATDTIIPFDVCGALDEVSAALQQVKTQWAGLPSNGADDDPGFAMLEADLAAAHMVAGKVSARVASGNVSESEATLLSAAIVAACKALVPVNYTVADRHDHDLALGAVPLPSLRPHRPLVEMSDDDLWAATHQLRRSINRVRAGVRVAAATLAEALHA